MDLEELPEIFPLYFFDASTQVQSLKKDKFSDSNKLPTFEDLNFSENFAEVFMGWTEDTLNFKFDVETVFSESEYPDFLRKDAIELFIHTRANSLSRYMNKFSHHFLIFPVQVNGIYAMEITKFRGEDKHDLCLPQAIPVKVDMSKNRYSIRLDLPKSILHGYDPLDSKELRIDYRIHRFQNEPQFFFFPTQTIAEHNLALWPKIELV